MSDLLQPGTQAPDFTLKSGDGDDVTLSDLRGQKVVLAFYPLDWSPGCQNQMDAFTAGNDEIAALGARVLGISVDSWWSHKAWKAACNMAVTLLSDFNPKGAVAKQYGVFNPENGYNRRITYFVDEQGVISSVDDNPGVDENGVARACSILSEM